MQTARRSMWPWRTRHSTSARPLRLSRTCSWTAFWTCASALARRQSTLATGFCPRMPSSPPCAIRRASPSLAPRRRRFSTWDPRAHPRPSWSAQLCPSLPATTETISPSRHFVWRQSASATRSCSRQSWVVVARACVWSAVQASLRTRSRRAGERQRRRLETTACSWKSSWSTLATWRCRCSAMARRGRAAPCTCSSVTARCRGGTKRCWKKRQRRTCLRSCAAAWARLLWRPRKPSSTRALALWSSCSTATVVSSTSAR
mmetsp:Transcript_24837/g.80004  ORF Transcript_24837/g.80004 Transcript_24837/m.80004 type:complete len:260 (+) Transcript_24837:277-1056(+)